MKREHPQKYSFDFMSLELGLFVIVGVKGFIQINLPS